jgi:hypothetical protein
MDAIGGTTGQASDAILTPIFTPAAEMVSSLVDMEFPADVVIEASVAIQSNDAEQVIGHILSDPVLAARTDAAQNGEDSEGVEGIEGVSPSVSTPGPVGAYGGENSETSALSSNQSSPSMIEHLNLDAVLTGLRGADPGAMGGMGGIVHKPDPRL